MAKFLKLDSGLVKQSISTDTLEIDTLTLDGASITDSSGTISFSADNLSTSGTLGAGAATLTSAALGGASIGSHDLSVSGTVAMGSTLAVTSTLSAATGSTLGSLTLANGSITDSSGSITFNDENLVTTGTLGAGVATLTSVATGGATIGSHTLAVTGSAAISGALTAGSMICTGDLTVNGTTTTVNSTTVTVDDPILTLGGDTAPSSDDNKDRGVLFRYHTGSAAALGFMGWDDSENAFALMNGVTDSSDVMSGTASKLIAGAMVCTTLNASGAVTLGDAAADTINLTGRIGSAVIPSSDAAYDLGMASATVLSASSGTVQSDLATSHVGQTFNSLTSSITSGGSITWGSLVQVGDVITVGDSFQANITAVSNSGPVYTLTVGEPQGSSGELENADAVGITRAALEWKDLYIDGTAYLDAATVDSLTLVQSMGFAGFAAYAGSEAAANYIPSVKDMVYIQAAGTVASVGSGHDNAAKLCGVYAAASSGATTGKLVMSGPATVTLAASQGSISAGAPIYLAAAAGSSTAGQVTDAAPTTGWVVRVGFANEASSNSGSTQDLDIMVSIGHPIKID